MSPVAGRNKNVNVHRQVDLLTQQIAHAGYAESEAVRREDEGWGGVGWGGGWRASRCVHEPMGIRFYNLHACCSGAIGGALGRSSHPQTSVVFCWTAQSAGMKMEVIECLIRLTKEARGRGGGGRGMGEREEEEGRGEGVNAQRKTF